MNSIEWQGLVLLVSVGIFFVVLIEVLISVYQYYTKDLAIEQRYFLKGVKDARALFVLALSVCGVAFMFGLEFWTALILGVAVSSLLFWAEQSRVTK